MHRLEKDGTALQKIKKKKKGVCRSLPEKCQKGRISVESNTEIKIPKRLKNSKLVSPFSCPLHQQPTVDKAIQLKDHIIGNDVIIRGTCFAFVF